MLNSSASSVHNHRLYAKKSWNHQLFLILCSRNFFHCFDILLLPFPMHSLYLFVFLRQDLLKLNILDERAMNRESIFIFRTIYKTYFLIFIVRKPRPLSLIYFLLRIHENEHTVYHFKRKYRITLLKFYNFKNFIRWKI